MIRQFHTQNRTTRRPATITVAPLSLTERIAPGSYTVTLYSAPDAKLSVTFPLVIPSLNPSNPGAGTAQINNAPFSPGDRVQGNIYNAQMSTVARIAAFTFVGVQSITYTSEFDPDVFPSMLPFMWQGGSSTVEIGVNVTKWMIKTAPAAWLTLSNTSTGDILADSVWYTTRSFKVKAMSNPFSVDRDATIVLQCRNSYEKEVAVPLAVSQNRKGLVPPIDPILP